MPKRNTVIKIARRTFLIGGAVLTGGLVVGYSILRDKPGTAGFEDWGEPGNALNAWVKITPDGDIILAVPRAEMGQGVYTSVAMLIAEELEVDLAAIKVEHPDLHGKYFNKFAMKDQTPISFAPASRTRARFCGSYNSTKGIRPNSTASPCSRASSSPARHSAISNTASAPATRA